MVAETLKTCTAYVSQGAEPDGRYVYRLFVHNELRAESEALREVLSAAARALHPGAVLAAWDRDRGEFTSEYTAEADPPGFIRFPEEWPETATRYTGAGAIEPTHSGYRGDCYLCHQPNQIRRDCTGEGYLRSPGEEYHVCILRDPEAIERHHGYRYIITHRGGTAHKAFRSREGFRDYLRAYSVTFRRGRRWEGSRVGIGWLTIGDPATWEPLNVRPIPPSDPRHWKA